MFKKHLIKNLRESIKIYAMKFISIPSIVQFRNIVETVKRSVYFNGFDTNGNPVYDETKKLPTLKFNGTVKLHGASAAIGFDPITKEIWFQSKENILTQNSNLMGFSTMMEFNKSVLLEIFQEIQKRPEYKDIVSNIKNNHLIHLFGEWAGKSVQKSVAISELPKSFYIFNIVVTEIDIPNNTNDELQNKRYYLDTKCPENPERMIYNLAHFPTFEIEIDFNNLQSAQHQLEKYVLEVEKECPVSKQLGVSGCGEGIVWNTNFNGEQLFFKTKGEEHKISQTVEKIPFVPEKIESIDKFAEYAMTKNRFEQAIDKVFGEEKKDIKRFGDLVRWINIDIQKEEYDVLFENNLEYSDVQKVVISKLKEMFLESCK